MSMGKFLKINNTAIPNTKEGGFTVTPNLIETVNQSEAGTDLVAVTRTSKPTFTMTFDLSSNWKTKLDAYAKLLSVTLEVDGVSYVGRFRAGSQQLVGNSAHTDGTQGLWTCQYTFTTI